MSGRAIERKHHVGRRTIRKALASATPPARKKISREPAALSGLHRHIDTMIAPDPQITTAAIWERLADEHGTTVAYPPSAPTSAAAGPPPGGHLATPHPKGRYDAISATPARVSQLSSPL